MLEVYDSEQQVFLSPQSLSAKVAVVAVPLGVLKTKALRIEPLPAWKRKAFEELGLGTALRAVLEFPEAFWPRKEFFMDTLWPGCHNSSFLDAVDNCHSARLSSRHTVVIECARTDHVSIYVGNHAGWHRCCIAAGVPIHKYVRVFQLCFWP